MSESRDSMIAALMEIIVPVLRERGFAGSFPHFRRLSENGIDLLSFQFDKWGGGFLIEISKCNVSGIRTHWGEEIPADKVRAIDNHPDQRHRLIPGKGPSRQDWFRFDQHSFLKSSERFSRAARSVLPYLEDAEDWWNRELPSPDE
jgi:hypothetical protein